MKHVLFIFILCISISVFSQNDTLFTNATKAYNEGNYEEAIKNYMEILESGHHSEELYFNLGNSHYKLNQVAPSIYYYEKALLLEPNDAEITNNLSYARNMTIDAIETLPMNSITQLYNKVVGLFSFNQWGYFAVFFMCLFVLFYIAFYYFRYSRRKRIALISSMLALLISLISLVFGFMAYNDFEADQPAIVFADEAIVKSEPNARSLEVFRLHEGTKLQVLEELNEWKKVSIEDGQTGWLASEDIKLLKNY